MQISRTKSVEFSDLRWQTYLKYQHYINKLTGKIFYMSLRVWFHTKYLLKLHMPIFASIISRKSQIKLLKVFRMWLHTKYLLKLHIPAYASIMSRKSEVNVLISFENMASYKVFIKDTYSNVCQH